MSVRQITSCLFLLSAVGAHADFSYQQTTRLTGGSLMRFAGMAGSKMTEPTVMTIAVKGNKMVHANAHTASVVDLDARTVTTISFDQKKFWVMTFDQMNQRLESATSNGGVGDVKVTVSDGPRTKKLLDHDTTEKILGVNMTVSDPRSGNNVDTHIQNDMFVASGIPGSREVRNFFARMSGASFSPGGVPGMDRPELMKVMSEMYKSVGTLDGLPLMTVLTVSGAFPGLPNMGAPPPTGPMGSGKGGAIAEMMKRRQEQGGKQDATPSTSTSGTNALLEMTMEVTSYSNKPAEAALFNVPAGFEKVDAPPMRTLPRR